MRLESIPTHLRVAGAAAAILLLSLFLPWYGASVEAFDATASVTAWQAFELIDVLLLILAGGVLAVVAGVGRERELPLPAATIVAALGIAAAILTLYRFLDLPFEGVDRRYGLFLGLAAAIGVAVAGWMAMREQGQTFEEARSEIGRGVDQARSQAADSIGGESKRREDMTRDELYEEAQQRDIEGRSDMDRQELLEALRRDR